MEEHKRQFWNGFWTGAAFVAIGILIATNWRSALTPWTFTLIAITIVWRVIAGKRGGSGGYIQLRRREPHNWQ
jgi:hypothetical protein